MSSISESGHAKNVANFETLISFVTAYGTAYNPSRESIKLPALQTILTSAKSSLSALNVVQPNYSNAVAAREVAFAPLSKLITRVNNALKASDTTSQIDESAKTIIRKLQGRRATPKITNKEGAALTAEGKEVNQISTSQLSFDNLVENLNKLIMLLTSIPLYNPNEEELKVSTLTALYNDLTSKNTDVLTATVPLSNARISRNDILYKEIVGLVDTAADVKLYIKSVFGATSPQYKQVSKLNFVNRSK